jgi:hypothetical protein
VVPANIPGVAALLPHEEASVASLEGQDIGPEVATGRIEGCNEDPGYADPESDFGVVDAHIGLEGEGHSRDFQ